MTVEPRRADAPPDRRAPLREAEAAQNPEEAYHSGTVLARNTVLNLLGQGVPLLVALFAIPLLDAGLGTARYGVLLIVWMFLGYFSLFDLGLSRALTQLLAERLGRERDREAVPLAWTALALTLALGFAGGAVLALLAPWIAFDVLTDLPAALRRDCLHAFYALAGALPLVTSTASLRGVLEARQRFDLINAVRIPMGIFTFAGPLLVLPFSPTLLAVVLALVAGRLAAWGVHLVLCLRAVPELRRGIRFERRLVGGLLRFGGWMTVSNVISPVMVYLDRFVIGAFISAAAVAYYATSWEVITKLLLVPAALVGVLFPSFSFWQSRDPQRVQRLYHTGLKLILLALFPLTLLSITFAEPILRLWMGPEYAAYGTRPMQLLALGVLANGLAGVPFVLLQGHGRPDLTAKLHAVELPLYGAALLWLLPAYGIVGVALGWLFRAALDLGLLMVVSQRFLMEDPAERQRILLGLSAAALLLGCATLPTAPWLQAVYPALVLPLFLGLSWRLLLTPEERHFLRERWAHHARLRRS